MYICRNYIECNRSVLCYGIVNLDKLMLWYEPRYTWYNLCILSHIHVRVVGGVGQSGGICFLSLPLPRLPHMFYQGMTEYIENT